MAQFRMNRLKQDIIILLLEKSIDEELVKETETTNEYELKLQELQLKAKCYADL